MKFSSLPAVVRIQASNVALPIATRSWTLVAFCGQIDEQISILLIIEQGVGARSIEAGVPAGRTCAAPPTLRDPPHPQLKRKNKERQAAARSD
ncbi:jg21282 [Pararge aegeria aegeria]|uniref:Jg21282 protein n=1 Tax=Pararge aegeria aegeria TaxID=348720 RepID=A0A8S4SG00_9NEOP|nr:jg21282 [Pararge aegeria aegeria]